MRLFVILFFSLCLPLHGQTTQYLFTTKTTNGSTITFGAELLTNTPGHLVIGGDGILASSTALNASNLSSGTVPTARLGSGTASSSNVLRGDQSWGTLSADMITSGTISTARLGSGTANSTTYLRGDGSWQTVSAGVSLSGTNQWTGQQSFNTASTTGAININPTWNSAGTVFSGIYMRATDTSSNAGSSLIDLGTGSTSTFRVSRTGNAVLNVPSSAGPRVDLYGFAGGGLAVGYGTSMGITGGGGTTTALRLDNGGTALFITAGNNATMAVNPTTTSLSFGTGVASMDTVISRVSAARLSISGSSGGAALQLTEMTAPTGPAANTVLIYAEDNGSGKTRIMALFPSGAAQQLAIEP